MKLLPLACGASNDTWKVGDCIVPSKYNARSFDPNAPRTGSRQAMVGTLKSSGAVLYHSLNTGGSDGTLVVSVMSE